MAYDSNLLVSSPATVLIGNYGEEYTEVGYTRDGITIRKTRTARDVEADQRLHPINVVATAEGYEITIRLLQVTYENLALMWDEPGVTGLSGRLGLSTSSEAKFKKIKIYGTRADGTIVTWEFPKCFATGFGDFVFSKTGDAIIETTYRVLWDDTSGTIGWFTPASES